MSNLGYLTQGTRRTVLCALTGAALMASSLMTGDAVAQKLVDPDAIFDTLLRRYVRTSPDGVNRVDYALWQANDEDRRALDRYVTELTARRPSTMTRDAAFAYWGNLYNAITLSVVLDRYPIASIRDIKSSGRWLDVKSYTGPWREERVTVEGKPLSLDNIEHDIMRPTFNDARVHYVVNCASFGCPNLMDRAWRASTLEADLNAAARAFVNHPRGVAVLPSGGLRVSSIYKWFIADFGGNDAGLIKHFKKFAGPELSAQLTHQTTIAEVDYEWSLNSTTVTTPVSWRDYLSTALGFKKR